MTPIDQMGIENVTQGICGFTSTLYAVYSNQPKLRERLESALDEPTRRTRMMAEIKSFLRMMEADGRNDILDQIIELTQSFPGYERWPIRLYIQAIDQIGVDGNPMRTQGDYSIAMPPEAVRAYMRSAWAMTPSIAYEKHRQGEAILGLTSTGAPGNRWNNLAHYVYQNAAGRVFSWGQQFDSLQNLNEATGQDYSVVYCIMVNEA